MLQSNPNVFNQIRWLKRSTRATARDWPLVDDINATLNAIETPNALTALADARSRDGEAALRCLFLRMLAESGRVTCACEYGACRSWLPSR